MLTIAHVTVTATAAAVCQEASGDRRAEITNDGLCPVWLGTNNVLVGAGRILWPGDSFGYDQPDELDAICNGNPAGSLSVSEVRS